MPPAVPTSPPAGTPSAPAGLRVALLVTLALSASHSSVFPLLAAIQEAHDLPTSGLGVIAAAAFAGNLAAQLVLARHADRGHARTLLVAGPALAGVALVGFAVSTELWQFVLARVASGVGVGCFMPAVRATLAAHDPARVGATLGRLASVDLAGIVGGPALSAGVAEVAGLEAPFVVLALGALVAVPFVWRIPLPPAAPPPAVGRRAAGPRELLRRPAVVVALLLGLALYFPAGVYEAMWSRYLQDLGASTLFTGVTLTLYGLPFVLAAPLGGRIADRFGLVRTSATCLYLALPFVVLYGIVDVPEALVPIAMVEAVLNATAVPAAQAAMVRACPPGSLAQGQGLSGAAGLSGAGLAALAAGPAYAAWGSEAVFGGVAALMALIAGAAVVLHRRTAPDDHAGAPPLAEVPRAA